MAGTRDSGNPWQYHMNPEGAEGAFIDFMCGKERMGKATWTFRLILIHYEKEAREFLGNELYERLLKKHSKTIIDQQLEHDQLKAKREAREEEDRELRKEEIEIKKQNSQTFKDNVAPLPEPDPEPAQPEPTPEPKPLTQEEKEALIAKYEQTREFWRNHKKEDGTIDEQENQNMIQFYQKEIEKLKGELDEETNT